MVDNLTGIYIRTYMNSLNSESSGPISLPNWTQPILLSLARHKLVCQARPSGKLICLIDGCPCNAKDSSKQINLSGYIGKSKRIKKEVKLEFPPSLPISRVTV